MKANAWKSFLDMGFLDLYVSLSLAFVEALLVFGAGCRLLDQSLGLGVLVASMLRHSGSLALASFIDGCTHGNWQMLGSLTRVLSPACLKAHT